MPRCFAFRSTVAMASLFSTLTAITSTPRVIHASTTSFCFAGSVSVGPSHNSVTPSAVAASSAPARQVAKYGLPLFFGIIAMVIFLAAARARAAAARRCPSTAVAGRQADATRAKPMTIVMPNAARLEKCRCHEWSWSPRNLFAPSATMSSAAVSTPASSAGRSDRRKSVLQHAQHREAEQGAADRAAAAEDRRAAENHRGDRHQFEPRAGVRLGLTEPRDVEQRRGRRRESRQEIHQGGGARHGQSGIAAPSVENPIARTMRPAVNRCTNSHAAIAAIASTINCAGTGPNAP